MSAHRALEEAVLTDKQNLVNTNWTRVGQSCLSRFYLFCVKILKHFYSILKNGFRRSPLKLSPGSVDAVAVSSKNILKSPEGEYAQSATWSESESKGFIKLIGQSTSTWASIHKKK